MTHSGASDRIALFERWYEHEMPSLYRYILYKVRDVTVAEEITATICERALSRLDQYDEARGEMKSWMFGIARNEIRRLMRDRTRRPHTVALEDQILRQSGPSVEANYEQREMVAMALEHIAKLPEIDSEILALRFGGGFGNNEIANMLDKTENHVAVRLHRALKKLREAMTEEGRLGDA